MKELTRPPFIQEGEELKTLNNARLAPYAAFKAIRGVQSLFVFLIRVSPVRVRPGVFDFQG